MPARSEEVLAEAREFDWLVGVNVRYWREQREISQYDLAQAANMSDSQISRIEAGERSVTLQQALAIAKRLNVKFTELLEEPLSEGEAA